MEKVKTKAVATRAKTEVKNVDEVAGFAREQFNVIKTSIMPTGSSDAETMLFATQCKRTGLDPFSRQIYATKIAGKLSVQATIDGFRLIAERSQKYQGQTIPLYLKADGVTWVEVWLDKEYPRACKVGVLKEGFKEPLYAIAKWDSYVQQTSSGVGFMWKKMPEVMLAKVAEALALRKAFPNDLSGIYSQEEMEQADNKPLNVQASFVVDEVSKPVVHNTAPDIDAHTPTNDYLEYSQEVSDPTPAVEVTTNAVVLSEFFQSVNKNVDIAIEQKNTEYLMKTRDNVNATAKLTAQEKSILLAKINEEVQKTW